jgi:hypothetical protein
MSDVGVGLRQCRMGGIKRTGGSMYYRVIETYPRDAEQICNQMVEEGYRLAQTAWSGGTMVLFFEKF